MDRRPHESIISSTSSGSSYKTSLNSNTRPHLKCMQNCPKKPRSKHWGQDCPNWWLSLGTFPVFLNREKVLLLLPITLMLACVASPATPIWGRRRCTFDRVGENRKRGTYACMIIDNHTSITSLHVSQDRKVGIKIVLQYVIMFALEVEEFCNTWFQLRNQNKCLIRWHHT